MRTHGVSRLLCEYLGKPDHVRVVSQFLSKIDHSVSGVLLIAGTVRGEKVIESCDSNRITLQATACLSLNSRQRNHSGVFPPPRLEVRRTQAASHFFVESGMFCAI